MTRGAWWRSGLALVLVALVLVLARANSDPALPEPVETTLRGDNGISRLPPAEILEAARTALVEARSVRMRGVFDDDGTPVRLDMRLLADGRASGWVSSGGRRFRLISVDGRTWLRGRAALAHWGSQALADRVGDRWVLVPSGTVGLPGAMELVMFADETLGPHLAADFVVGPSGTVNGQPAVRLDGSAGSWWVATTGPPYPLRLETRLSLDGPVQRLDLSEFDREVTIRAPANAVDLTRAG